jgi:hypothetical protein
MTREMAAWQEVWAAAANPGERRASQAVVHRRARDRGQQHDAV